MKVELDSKPPALLAWLSSVDRPILLLILCVLGLLLCNFCIFGGFAARAVSRDQNRFEQENDARALFLWDIRNCTAILPPVTDHQLILRTSAGPISYIFDPNRHLLTRTAGTEVTTVLEDLQSASFFLCHSPHQQISANTSNAVNGGLITLTWILRDKTGYLSTHKAAARL